MRQERKENTGNQKEFEGGVLEGLGLRLRRVIRKLPTGALRRLLLFRAPVGSEVDTSSDWESFVLWVETFAERVDTGLSATD